MLERDSAALGNRRAARGLLRGGLAPEEVGDAVRRTGARVVHAHNVNPSFGWRALAAAREAGRARRAAPAQLPAGVRAGDLLHAAARTARAATAATRCPGVRLNCRGGSRAEAAVYAAGLALWQRRLARAGRRVRRPERVRAGAACASSARRSTAREARETARCVDSRRRDRRLSLPRSACRVPALDRRAPVAPVGARSPRRRQREPRRNGRDGRGRVSRRAVVALPGNAGLLRRQQRRDPRERAAGPAAQSRHRDAPGRSRSHASPCWTRARRRAWSGCRLVRPTAASTTPPSARSRRRSPRSRTSPDRPACGRRSARGVPRAGRGRVRRGRR